jgi:glycogen phosphorylase
VAMAKRSIATISPRFNTTRMVSEYVNKFYAPAAAAGRRFAANNFAVAHDIADWKSRIRAAWTGVRLQRLDAPDRRMQFGGSLHIEVAVQLNGLTARDVTVEALFGRPSQKDFIRRARHYPLKYSGNTDQGEALYKLELTPELCGLLEYRIRVFPTHSALIHPLETGLMVWL